MNVKTVLRNLFGNADVDCPVADGALTTLRVFAGLSLASRRHRLDGRRRPHGRGS